MIPFLERPVAHGRGMFMRVEKSFLPHRFALGRVDFSFQLPVQLIFPHFDPVAREAWH
jgi:hypothetical protein